TMNRNIRDVLGHLHHWHKLMVSWYEIGMRGEKPEMPAPGYTWKTVPALNREIHQMYTAVTLEELKVLLAKSHASMISLIEQHNEVELFEKKRYPWTGSTSLAAYLISATSSHYAWARKLIRKQRKALKAAT
ncbi:MAG: ClbS/DfsB family four-helix bundle protein, partial [Bacteroidota bacterium]